jgi:hypothetical protein
VDETRISMLVEDMSRNKCFPRFEYHMFYVLYSFVTYLQTLPRSLKETEHKILRFSIANKSERFSAQVVSSASYRLGYLT